MNRRKFFDSVFGALGIAASLALAPIIKLAGGDVFPKTGYRTYVMGENAILFDKELIENLKAESKIFKSFESRERIEFKYSKPRQFFQYDVMP